MECIYVFRMIFKIKKTEYFPKQHLPIGLYHGDSVSCEARTDILNIIYMNLKFQGPI
jgi:hypothetical protein